MGEVLIICLTVIIVAIILRDSLKGVVHIDHSRDDSNHGWITTNYGKDEEDTTDEQA